jgi:hypothetical protein
VVDDSGFVKDGAASTCVARQYPGSLGKVANRQIAVSVHAATTAASGVLDWRLFVSERWDATCVPDPDGIVANPHARRLTACTRCRSCDRSVAHHKPTGQRPVPRSWGLAF